MDIKFNLVCCSSHVKFLTVFRGSNWKAGGVFVGFRFVETVSTWQ